ncbi:TlpA family protein disulfide reductase [Formosa haliotis]|uniref:TlpA family protein disulfide reductase n=1 Tax=Formosa haliotis TaxID=1555194 RepID=UPI0008260C02|nr:TlpA disulfide reductase family protein [Formosa haliotis]
MQRAKIDSISNQDKYEAFKNYREEVIAVKKSKDSVLMEQVKAKMNALEPLENELQEELKNYKIQFIRENPSSPVMIPLLGMSFSEITMTRDEMKEVYTLFEGDAKKAGRFRFIKKTYEDYVEKFAIGATVEDFTLKTVEGENLTLSEVKAKYILVDFWASWCVPCRASFPSLKKTYDKYKKDGFEIIAVATGDKDEAWRIAIEKDQTVWKHVFDVTEENAAQGTVAIAYGVPFLPTTYLLDNNRTIIARNPTKEELENKLKELFGY